MKKTMKSVIGLIVLIVVFLWLYRVIIQIVHEKAVLKQVISRLEADSRAAEVLVTGVNYNEKSKKTETTIKFLEYDTEGNPLEPKYFTFSGNIIQFQSLVVRFDDIYIRGGHKLKGKSAYLFWKVFVLDGKNTEEFNITKAHNVPSGYRIAEESNLFEKDLWARFWDYALNPETAKNAGIKNAQIEAPGTMFIPGILYNIKIEHDGGLRIDFSHLSPIFKGETIPL